MLSDPHERTWYDQHKADILGQQPAEGADGVGVNLFRYFSENAFNDYDESDKVCWYGYGYGYEK